MSRINEIISNLKADASYDSSGRFTLDKKKAKEKMQAFQLINPAYYVLELIEAAVATGASHINITVDSDDFIMSFDGRPYSKEDFENIYSSLFVSQKDMKLDRLRELAIGFNSAQALRPGLITILSGDGKTAHRLTFTPPDKEVISESPEVISGTMIHVKEKLSGRVANKFISRYILGKVPAEEKIIKERCIYSPIPIYLNGRIVNPDSYKKLENVLFQINFKKQGLSGILGLPAKPAEFSVLSFVKWGVLISISQRILSAVPCYGIIYGNGLIKNISQSEIVDNDIFRETLIALKNSLDDLMIEAAKTIIRTNMHDEREVWSWLAYCLQVYIKERFTLNDFLNKPTVLLKHLCMPDIFPTADGRLINLETIIAQYKKISTVPFVRKSFNFKHPEGLEVLLLDQPMQYELFNDLFKGNLNDVENIFNREVIRKTNLKIFKDAKVESIILSGSVKYRVRISKGKITGEVGIVYKNDTSFTDIEFFINNSFISKKRLYIKGLYISASVNNNDLLPAYTYDDLERDDEFYNTVKTIVETAREVYMLLADDFNGGLFNTGGEEYEFYRQCLLGYINYMLEKKEAQKLTCLVIRESDFRGAYELDTDMLFSFPCPDEELDNKFRKLKLFNTVSGKTASLSDLEEDIKKYGKVSYVDTPVKSPQLNDRHVIILTGNVALVLEKYFGKDNILDYSKKLAEEQVMIKYLNRHEESVEIS